MSCNLLTAIGTLLPEFFWTFTFPKFYGGNVGCKLMKYFFMVGPYLSSYTLVMTAVDRYQVLKMSGFRIFYCIIFLDIMIRFWYLHLRLSLLSFVYLFVYFWNVLERFGTFWNVLENGGRI